MPPHYTYVVLGVNHAERHYPRQVKRCSVAHPVIATYAPDVATDSEYPSRLGLVLRTARYVRELTREEVAVACGVDVETVGRWECVTQPSRQMWTEGAT